MIDSILTFLNNDFNNEGYYVKEFSDDLFFGKDRNGNIVCVRKNDTKEQSFSLKTTSIELYQNYHFTLHSVETVIDDNFDMIILMEKYADTRRTFVNLCLNFYSTDDDRSIVELTEDLIELYKIPKNNDTKSEQGLWAEFFTINYLYETYNINISEYWHNDSFNKYDFSLSETLKLEVKSTTKEIREHHFSHEQVYTNYDVVISSIMMRKDDSGLTIMDLYNKTLSLFSSKYNLLSKIEKELVKFDQDKLIKFDYEYAKESIKFYLNKTIPHLDIMEPDGVHGTEYTIVLEGVESIDDNTLNRLITENSGETING